MLRIVHQKILVVSSEHGNREKPKKRNRNKQGNDSV